MPLRRPFVVTRSRTRGTAFTLGLAGLADIAGCATTENPPPVVHDAADVGDADGHVAADGVAVDSAETMPQLADSGTETPGDTQPKPDADSGSPTIDVQFTDNPPFDFGQPETETVADVQDVSPSEAETFADTSPDLADLSQSATETAADTEPEPAPPDVDVVATENPAPSDP